MTDSTYRTAERRTAQEECRDTQHVLDTVHNRLGLQWLMVAQADGSKTALVADGGGLFLSVRRLRPRKVTP